MTREFENPPPAKSALPVWLGLTALAALIYLPNLGAYDLWAPDEPRFGQVVREMIAYGNWIVPHVNGEVYTDKPPLFFWIVGLLALLQGGEVTSWITRLPSALAAIGGVLVTFAIGRRLFDRRVGAVSAIALCVTIVYMYQGRSAQLDMLMSFFTFLAMWGFVVCYQSERPHPAGAVVFWAAMALGTLSKGPPGLISVLGGALLFLGVRREWRAFGRTYPVRGCLLLAALLCAWLIPMNLMVPKADTEDLLLHQTIVRYFAAESHEEPWYFFLESLSYGFLPWIVFLPSALFVLYPRRQGAPNGAGGSRWASSRTLRWLGGSAIAFVIGYGGLTAAHKLGDFRPEVYPALLIARAVLAWVLVVPWLFWAMCRAVRMYDRPAVQLLLSWFLFTMFFFSLSSGKRDQYILVMYPSLAILIGAFLTPYLTGAKPFEKEFWIPAAILPILLGVGAIVAPFLVARVGDIEEVARAMHLEITPLIIIAAIVAVALAVALLLRHARLAFALTVVAGGTTALYLVFVIFPPIDALKSGRRLCYAIETEHRPGDRVMSYDIFRAEYILFGDYFVTEVNDYGPIAEAFRGPERVFCILRAGSLGNLKRALGDTPCYLLWRDYTGNRLMAVVSNRPSRLPHLREDM